MLKGYCKSVAEVWQVRADSQHGSLSVTDTPAKLPKGIGVGENLSLPYGYPLISKTLQNADHLRTQVGCWLRRRVGR